MAYCLPVSDAGRTLQLAQIALLGEAAEHVPDVAFFLWDEDRNYVAVNAAGCELVGHPREELLRMKVGDTSAERASPHFELVQQAGLHTGSLTVDRPDGPVDIEWVTCRTRLAGVQYMMSICWRKGAT